MASWTHLMKTIIFVAFIWKLANGSKVSIVRGQEVKAHSKPWMASVQVDHNHVCGGTLVKAQWVLTAAHCLSSSISSDRVSVLLGAHNLKKNDEATQRVGIERRFTPPKFSMQSKVDDIMLIKLKAKVKTTRHVKEKNLPKSGNDPHPGAKCQVIGWGAQNDKVQVASDVLRWAGVDVVDRELCGCLYGNNPVITEDMMCARDREKGADACTGDSGGPLECNKVLVGVVSGGTGCGNPKKPGVYTRLSGRHLTWIRSTLQTKDNSTSTA